MSSSRPWVKVWQTWWSSASHVHLKLETLAVGLRVMSLTGASPDQEGESRFCLRADGGPMSLVVLARECRCTVGKLAKAIDALIEAGTMVRREDGAIGFAKWDEYQLSPRALRDRRKEAKETAANCRQTAAPTTGQTAEHSPARGQRSEVRDASHLTPVAPKGAKSKRRPAGSELEDDLEPGLVDCVLVAMRDAVKSVTRGRDRGPLDSPGNRDLIRTCTRREQATLEQWRRVIAAQAESVRSSPDAWRYLALSTLCRRANWLRLLDAPIGRGSPRGPVDPRTQDHDTPPEF